MHHHVSTHGNNELGDDGDNEAGPRFVCRNRDLWGQSVMATAYNETPSGTVDGVNKTFTLAHTPSPADSLMLFLKSPVVQPIPTQQIPTEAEPFFRQRIFTGISSITGQSNSGSFLLQPEDYSLSTNTITMVIPPPTGSSLRAASYEF